MNESRLRHIVTVKVSFGKLSRFSLYPGTRHRRRHAAGLLRAPQCQSVRSDEHNKTFSLYLTSESLTSESLTSDFRQGRKVLLLSAVPERRSCAARPAPASLPLPLTVFPSFRVSVAAVAKVGGGGCRPARSAGCIIGLVDASHYVHDYTGAQRIGKTTGKTQNIRHAQSKFKTTALQKFKIPSNYI